jgi:hypothetical protein
LRPDLLALPYLSSSKRTLPQLSYRRINTLMFLFPNLISWVIDLPLATLVEKSTKTGASTCLTTEMDRTTFGRHAYLYHDILNPKIPRFVKYNASSSSEPFNHKQSRPSHIQSSQKSLLSYSFPRSLFSFLSSLHKVVNVRCSAELSQLFRVWSTCI